MSYDVVTTIWPTVTLTVTDNEAQALYAQGLILSSTPTLGVSVTSSTPVYNGGTAAGRAGLIKVRYGTAAEWATAEASAAQVAAGEVILTDTGFCRGDGVTKVASLTRIGGSGGGSVSYADRGAWATTTVYALGDVATQAGVRYLCRTAHTGGTFATDLAASKWIALAPVVAADATLSNLSNAGTARTNLGLGGAAVLNVGTTTGTVAAGDDSRITGAAQKVTPTTTASTATTGTLTAGVLALVDASSANLTRTLPSAASAGAGGVVAVRNVGSSTSNTVTIQRAGSDTINVSGTSRVLTYPEIGITLVSDGVTGWTVSSTDTPTSTLTGTFAPLASPALTGTPVAPTAAADTNTTQVATTAYVVGQASASSPVMNGAATVGTSVKFARADHAHPIDTSRAPVASPALTGTPTAPTAAAANNSTQIATTAYVDTAGALKANVASPTFTGTPAAPTATAATSTTQLATTAFVQQEKKALDRGSWLTATSYAVRDVVTQGTSPALTRYECATAHTSGTFSTDLSAARWVALDAGTAVPLATAGQGPAQEPVIPAAVATVGTLAYAARADHVHPLNGLGYYFGDASDGNIVLDGTNTYPSLFTKSGNNYYAVPQEIYANNLTIGAGVTLYCGVSVFVAGTLTVTGTWTAPFVNASGASSSAVVNGSVGAPGWGGSGQVFYPISIRGAGGGTGVGTTPSSPSGTLLNTVSMLFYGGNPGGAGGTGTSGAGGAGLSTTGVPAELTRHLRNPNFALSPFVRSIDSSASTGFATVSMALGGAPGGSGAGDATNSGGAGGHGGFWILCNARTVTGAGALSAPGGAGGTPPTGNCGGGGGGGGGVVLVNTLNSTGWSGTMTAAGGVAGAGVGTGTSGTAGAAGRTIMNTWL